jgi:hypothetical protein
MTIIDNEITAREFKKIQWNKLSESLDPNKLLKLKLNLTSIIDQAISIELNDDNLLSTRRELVEFISICILKIKSILSIDNDITIEVGEELLNEEYSVPASFDLLPIKCTVTVK